jgi:hypothetical protein
MTLQCLEAWFAEGRLTPAQMQAGLALISEREPSPVLGGHCDDGLLVLFVDRFMLQIERDATIELVDFSGEPPATTRYPPGDMSRLQGHVRDVNF